MAVDFSELDGLEIRKADESGFGVYSRMFGDDGEPRLVAAFTDSQALFGWLKEALSGWISSESED